MGKPDSPTPPDPKDTAQAQTGTNIGTTIANNTMSQVNRYTPDGSLTYKDDGYTTYTDPFTKATYQIPKSSSTITLSPQQQAIKDQNDAAKLNLAGTANDQSGFLREYLGTPANFDTSAIEGRLSELGSQRLDPRFEQQRAATEARLANQGIAPGSEAYNREMTSLEQSKNDAYNQLYLQGRGQAFNELGAMRNQPINEITALLSGSQVSQPNVAPATPQGMPTTDVAGLINENYNQRYNNYQQKNAQTQSLLGGLFGLASGGLTGGYF